MIQKIRNSRTFKGFCVFMAFNIMAQIISPLQALALSGGPAQPEFSSFTPIGTSDMVDLSSGDMSYNIPLMDVGGYPLNIAYASGVGSDDEAAWVGLGWNLSVGQINDNVRGIPDDFQGDEIKYEDFLKPNVTVGGGFKFTPALFGVDASGLPVESDVSVSYGVNLGYNNYSGFSMKPSVGVNVEVAKNVSVGFNAESGPDGISISPNVSFHTKKGEKGKRNTQLASQIGCSFSSRQGLTTLSLDVSRTTSSKIKVGDEKNAGSRIGTGGSIGFTDNLFTPTVRTGMVTGSFSAHITLGSEFFGGEGQGDITAFGTIQEIRPEALSRSVKAFGYPNSEKGNKESVLDFNREKDGSVSVNSTNLPLTNYTYDIHSVQGQGVSGMYRPYRNQVGYVYDAYADDISVDGTLGLEFGVGNAAHFGMDVGVTVVKSHSGLWGSNGAINNFKNNTNNSADYELVHYKNVGDLSVDQEFTADETSNANAQLFRRVGGFEPVKNPIVGSKYYRAIQSRFSFKQTNPSASFAIGGAIKRNKRQIRNQSIHNVTNAELAKGIGYGPLVGVALDAIRKPHHIGEVQVTRNDGVRYIYGLPAQNIVKKEVTFSVDGTVDCPNGLVSYNPANVIGSDHTNLPNDKYFNSIETPTYAHSHLLTSVLSTDYQDVDNNGPTENDLGSYTRFFYAPRKNNPGVYKWRVPLEKDQGSYNEGLKTEVTDDQGSYVYGDGDSGAIDQFIPVWYDQFIPE